MWKPINIRLDKVPTLVCALAKLNNMCINDMGSHRNPTMDTACLGGLVADGADVSHTIQSSVYSSYEEAATRTGTRRDLEKSTQREILRHVLHQNNMRRPLHSKFSYM